MLKSSTGSADSECLQNSKRNVSQYLSEKNVSQQNCLSRTMKK